MFAIGAILHIDAPIASKKKYNTCFGQNEYTVTLCLFLNSDRNFEGQLEFVNEDFPELPKTGDGLSMVSHSMVPRYTEENLLLFRARKLGMLKPDAAEKLLDGIQKSGGLLTGGEKRFLIAALREHLGR